MGTKIVEFKIIEDNKTIFDKDDKYVIPLYQRAFAWEDTHLVQLIDDIKDFDENDNYHLGSLIVARDGNKYEVVDGQQRLTALFLLISCLGKKIKRTLSFECRDKSNYTLDKLHDLLEEKRSSYNSDEIDQGIFQGIKSIKEKLSKDGIKPDELLKKLEKVLIYRIEVPENTDLNRYFEIMNTRGEQLEQQDILKSNLMSFLKNDTDRNIFSKIWEACSDMTGYVQMHFDRGSRDYLFGSKWDELPSDSWSDYKILSKNISNERSGLRIENIINKNFKISYDEVVDEDNNRVRFESIIEFPYFLLHVLRVFIQNNSVSSLNNNEWPLKLLDDKKLLDDFKSVRKNGIYQNKRIFENETFFTKDFILFLLRCRFLFDKYILKREFANDNSEGEWSLKELYVSGQKNNKKPYYKYASFPKKHERDAVRKNNERAKINIMIQSALRVSYTSPKIMHWITELLLWLSDNKCKNSFDNMYMYEKKSEMIAKTAVKELFFEQCKEGKYLMGTNTPHIVFNYLDFLLWESDKKKYNDFDFEFRNSVEHWYPQHPSIGSSWTDGVDQFGNLCIIQRNINARFSNLNPEAKKIQNPDTIKKGSLKLRIMSELTQKNGNKSAIDCWKDDICQQHGKEMIEILKAACGIEEE